MMKRLSRNSVFATTFVSALALALGGGCAPIDNVELETFLRDLLRNAAAAFLL